MTGGRLLVTGASGFIGSHVVQEALSVGFEVHAVSRTPSQDGKTNGVRWHTADLLSDGAPARLMTDIKPTHLLHAAWETTHGSYWTSPDNNRWVAATACLANAFAENGGLRFVLVGSCAEYDWSHGVMIEDVTPTRPHTLYGTSKLAAHNVVQSIASTSGLSAVTGRLFFAFGPHENVGRLIPYVSRQLASRQEALLSHGRQIRDFMHVEDVAHALVHLLESSVGGAVNVGLGDPIRLCEIATSLGQVSGRPHQVRLGARPDRPDDVAILVPDTRRLRDLGWQPQVSLEEGLATTYAWWAARTES